MLSYFSDFQEFREALIRVACEKWEDTATEEGRQPIDVKFGWVLEALMHLYEACLEKEGKDKLIQVSTVSKIIKNNNLVFQEGTFFPLNVGLGEQRQSSYNNTPSSSRPSTANRSRPSTASRSRPSTATRTRERK